MATKFLETRGGCVLFMDYSHYSSGGYFYLTPYFDVLTDILVEKINKVADPKNVVMFGMSFGARMVVHAGIKISRTDRKISKIFSCDPAGKIYFNLK
jgi:hypothetical protein